MRYILSSLFVLAAYSVLAQDTLSVLFAGDAMSHLTQAKWAKTVDGYDYSDCFVPIQPYLNQSDYNIVNLETPLAGRVSGYPKFSAPDSYLDALKGAGFNLFLLANNHVMDCSKEGMERTIGQLEQRCLPYAGAYADGLSRDSLYPCYITLGNSQEQLTFAIFNCTYGTNGLPVTAPCVVNRLDTAEIRKDYQTSLQRDADFRIMCVHWGVEYKTKASDNQRKLAYWLADLGFDLIIGSHPHVVQEYEVITTADGRQVPVFYSLGNLISNQRWRGSNGGILASVRFLATERTILDVSYLPVYVHKGSWKGKKQYFLLPTPELVDTLDRVPIPKADRDSLIIFHNDTRERLNNLTLTPVLKTE